MRVEYNEDLKHPVAIYNGEKEVIYLTMPEAEALLEELVKAIVVANL